MKLTPQQQLEIEEAKAAGRSRVSIRFTEAQQTEWEHSVGEELASKDESIARVEKIKAACRQPGFFADVRRAITASGRPIDELAVRIGVNVSLLADFRAGEAELPAAAIELLIETLRLRLMQEIAKEATGEERV